MVENPGDYRYITSSTTDTDGLCGDYYISIPAKARLQVTVESPLQVVNRETRTATYFTGNQWEKITRGHVSNLFS